MKYPRNVVKTEPEMIADADGCNLAIDVWTAYHEAPANKDESVVDAANSYDEYVDDFKGAELEAFKIAFFGQLLSLTQVPRQQP